PPPRPYPLFLRTLIERASPFFLQRQIGSPPHQIKQPFLVLLERGAALPFDRPGFHAAGLAPSLCPSDGSRIPDHEMARGSTRRLAIFDSPDHPNPQILRVAHQCSLPNRGAYRILF